MRAMRKYILLSILMTVFFLNAAGQGFMKTSLEITIRDRLGNTVEEVKVKLYKTYDLLRNVMSNIINSQLVCNLIARGYKHYALLKTNTFYGAVIHVQGPITKVVPLIAEVSQYIHIYIYMYIYT